jgi:hypothetical protein
MTTSTRRSTDRTRIRAEASPYHLSSRHRLELAVKCRRFVDRDEGKVQSNILQLLNSCNS